MIDKFFASAEAALADVPNGATILIGGFGGAGMPVALIDALIGQGARELTIVNNNAGNGDTGLAALGFEPVGGSPAQFSAYLKKELAKWGQMVKETGARVD